MSRAPNSRHEYRDAVLSEHGPSTSAARLVALALTADMDSTTLESYAGAERLAIRSAQSERTVRTALKVLVAEGWIDERTKGRGRDCWLKIRRATLPARVAAIIAGSQGGVPAMVAGDPVPEIPKKNPGAAAPLPAAAGSAAPEQLDRVKAEVWKRLKAGRTDGQIVAEVAELGVAVTLDQVQHWRRLRELNPFRRGAAR